MSACLSCQKMNTLMEDFLKKVFANSKRTVGWLMANNKFFWMKRLLMRAYTTNEFIVGDQVGGGSKHE